jgi:hypothetical protein
MKGVPQDAAPREMKVAKKYESHRSVAAIGKVNLPARRGCASPHGNYISIRLASSGTIHWAVQGPRAATTGLQRKTALSVKKPQQFLRFQAK